MPETLAVEQRHTGGLSQTLGVFRQLLGDRNYAPFAASYSIGFGAMFAYIAGSSYVLENVYGISAQAYSAVFAANSVGLIAVSQISRRLVERHGPRPLLRLGLSLTAVGAVATLAVCAATRRRLAVAHGAVHRHVRTGAGAAERHGRGDGQPLRRARQRLRPDRAQPVRDRRCDRAAGRPRWHPRCAADGDRDGRLRRGRACDQPRARKAARRRAGLAPDLVRDLDDQLELGQLLVDRQAVALLGRGEAALAGEAELVDVDVLRRLARSGA